MSCAEKRHGGHRAGSMPHHRFPNGFAELFMDEDDREVKTLTDRAFRSLCVGDDAIYSEEFSYGLSPFSCHKPLVEEPLKKTHHKHHSQNGANEPRRQQQHKNMPHVSAFLKAFGATEKSCEGMLIENGDSNGESWDKSALRSIRQELSEFSSDYESAKDAALPTGKSSKTKNGKATVRLRKLNIKNFFLHSEFSPFQTWRDFNSFPFASKDMVTSILPTDNLPKWYDSLLYKQLTEAHRIETLHTEETQECQKAAVEPPPPPPSPPPPPPPPPPKPVGPKVLPKPSATLAEKRCSSERNEGSAPWRRNRSRAQSVVLGSHPVVVSPPQDKGSKTVEEALLSIREEVKSVRVKAIEEVDSLASTPFSICQLMTPLIPSRQPTETSEILQAVFSTLDLPLRPESEAKLTPEPPVKRDSYKSLASSILFNLKDNRKRVKSRYSPPKFRTSELFDRSTQSPRLDLVKHTQALSDGTASGFSTPAILKEGQPIRSPIMDPANTPTVCLRKCDNDGTISDDYLISNLLQTKREAAGSRNEENNFSPFTRSKKNKSPLANKKNYPSLNLYKKSSPVDSETKQLQVPPTTDTLLPINKDRPTGQNKGLSPNIISGNEGLSPNIISGNEGLSPNIISGNKELSPNIISGNEGLSPNIISGNKGLSPNIISGNKGLSPHVISGNKELSPHVISGNKGLSPNIISGNKGLSPNIISGNKELSPNIISGNKELSPNIISGNKELSPHIAPDKGCPLNATPIRQGVSPNIIPAKGGLSPNVLPSSKEMSPRVPEKEGLSLNVSVDKGRSPNALDDVKGAQPVLAKEKSISSQSKSTMDVIKAAREAITAAKNKALSVTQSDGAKRSIADEPRGKETDKDVVSRKEPIRNSGEALVTERNTVLSPNRTGESDTATVNKNSDVKREPPPVPKRNFTKSDIQLPLDVQEATNVDGLSNGDIRIKKHDPSVPKEKESVRKQGRFKHIFSARQNNYIKSQRYVMTEEEREEERDDEEPRESVRGDEVATPPAEMRDSRHIVNDLHALKGIERAKLGDRVLENARNKLGLFRIEEEAKAKNDLISRELRNIKRGMLSMRANTFSKRDVLTKKEQEQSKQEMFTKIDSNVIVNKALINNNYDKAKMALEEVISERLKYKSGKEEDVSSTSEENAGEESCVERVQQCKTSIQDSLAVAEEMHNGSMSVQREKEMRERLKEKEMRERVRDLKGNKYLKQILSQAEAKHGETHSSGGKMPLPGMDKGDAELNQLLPNKYKHMTEGHGKLVDKISHMTDGPEQESTIKIEGGDNLTKENGGDGKKRDTPSVPPRIKKGGNRRESISSETESVKDVAEEDDRDSTNYKVEAQSVKEMTSTVLVKYEPNCEIPAKEMATNQNKISVNEDIWGEADDAKVNDNGKVDVFVNPAKKTKSESNVSEPAEQRKVKRKAPLKPDFLNALEEEKTISTDDVVTKNLVVEEPDKTNKATEAVNVDENALSESTRKIVSPLLQLNGININCQSPPDHSSLSSKSSYFSAESALHRNTETESNVYNSLENLIRELDEDDDGLNDTSIFLSEKDSGRAEMDYYSLSDHESEADADKLPVVSPQREKGTPGGESVECRGKHMYDVGKTPCSPDTVNNQRPTPPSTSFGIPALFRVKNNTSFSSKVVKAVQPWSPRESLSGSERGDEELYHLKESPEVPLTEEVTMITSSSATTPDANYGPKETLTHDSPLALFSHSNLLKEFPKGNSSGYQLSAFLAVPPEDNRSSDVSPLSEQAESFAGSVGDYLPSGIEAVNEGSKVPSERSGSTCSGNDSQPGLPKPPAVLPKSEKALLKAMKLTTRRIRKEEAQTKSSHKSSRSGSKQRASKQRGDTSEHKSSETKSSSGRGGGSGDKHHGSSEDRHGERTEQRQHHSKSHSERTEHGDKSEQAHQERQDHSSEKQHGDRSDHTGQKRLSYDSERNPTFQRGLSYEGERHPPIQRRLSYDGEKPPTIQRRFSYDGERPPNVSTERQGRHSEKRIRDITEHRNYSSDRVISDVPVYKAHVTDRPDRQYQRSQSIDRHLGDKVERRLSTDAAANDRLDPRSQRIEKSIMDEFQQRGRIKERAGRDNLVKRSQSIDTYNSEVSHAPNLSRQSSYTSQLSRQSSIEHAIVTQGFPMTQRKLLQDPDSGQYFFVDMPVQVKTKTFFDPETGNYVQLPMQPQERAVPQASPIEVLNTPMVLYHGFVPVPLSSMAQGTAVQASQMEQEEFEQRHVGRARLAHSKEGRPYLEPVYGQQDHMLGEFLGTEELDCVS